jgi:hypothetical protein
MMKSDQASNAQNGRIVLMVAKFIKSADLLKVQAC